MNKPEVHFESCHESGNIYFVMGLVREALRNAHRITEWNKLRDQILSSGSYEEALAHIQEHVNLIDDDGRYQL